MPQELLDEVLRLDRTGAGAAAAAAQLGPEARKLLDALERAGGNKSRAAQILGMSRVTLWRRLRELGLAQAPETLR